MARIEENGAFPAREFARLLRGDQVDCVDLDEPWRSLVQDLSYSDGKSRLEQFKEKTKERTDAAELLEAIFAVDPDGKPKANQYTSQTKTLADALAPRQRLPFLVKGFIPRRSLNIIYGWEGSLKTMLLLDLSFCVALGEFWLPDLPHRGTCGYPVTPAPVLWIDVDNGEDVMSERLAAFACAYEAPITTPIYWMSFPEPPILAFKGLRELMEHARSLGVGLICIDNLLRIAGVKDENSSEMDLVMGNLRKLSEVTGAAVVVSHHRTKASNRRESSTIRGHSSIAAATDYIYLIKREGGGDAISILNTKARRKPVDTFGALFTYELDDDGETLRSARFCRAQTSNEKQDGAAMLKTKILEALNPMKTGHKVNQTKLYQKVGGMKTTFLAALGQLVEDQRIKCATGKGVEKLYSLM